MEGDTGGLIMMAEAGAEVEAGATESGASEPPQAAMEADQYEDETDVMDDDDEVGKILSKGDYDDNSPAKRRCLPTSKAKGVWVWIRRLKKHQALTTTNPTQRRTHVCTRPGCWRLIKMGYDQKQNCWKVYRKRMASLEWPIIFPELELQTGYTSFDLMDADLGRVLNILKNDDPDASQYGFLPYMATHSRGSVGSLLASSYAERINSAANLILTKGNTVLAEEEINMPVCTVLRMNRRFMEFMRKYHPDRRRQSAVPDDGHFRGFLSLIRLGK